MKSSKSIILCAIGLSLLFSSCKKEEWLNPQPTTLITDVTAFSTPDRIQNQVNGLYASMKASRYYGSWFLIVSDIRSGEFHCSNMNAATGSTMYSMLPQTTTSDVSDIWEAMFACINKVNVFLDNMDNGGDAVLDATIANNYRAEARLIRGITYYNLLQLYARPYWDGNGSKPGLPLRLVGNTSSGNYDLARSSVVDTYKQVLEDLDFAEQNLPNNYSSAFLNTVRAHKNTAIALKTRVYLSMRDYPKVIAEANKIVSNVAPFTAISGVANKLEANFADVFKSPYTSNESIFSMPYANTDAPGSALSRYYLPGTGDGGTASSNGAGEYSLNKVEGVYSSPVWASTDARRGLTKIGTTTNKAWLTKFNQASPYIDYVPVIRYSEVLLNLAEAIARNSNTVDARSLSLFNAVYGRSNQGSALSFGNVTEYLNRIIEERRIEFLGEGLRNGDMMRLGLTIPAKTQHNIVSVAPDAPEYILPIPAAELILNNLMENN